MNMEKSLERAQSFVDFVNTFRKFPTAKTSDPVEYKLAVWIVQIRQAKRGTASKSNRMLLYPEVEELLNKHVPNWLNGAGQSTGNRLAHCEQKARKIVSFVQTHARFPVSTPGTPYEERVLAHFLNRMRMAKRKTSSFVCEIHPSVEKILDEIEDWLNPQKRKML
jgi:hypothetical protein